MHVYSKYFANFAVMFCKHNPKLSNRSDGQILILPWLFVMMNIFHKYFANILKVNPIYYVQIQHYIPIKLNEIL